jgi:serine/threonine protein kinase
MTGTRLGHYDILEKLGEGGMGVVYKARDTHLERFVAIKVLPEHVDEDRKRRFVQEAKAASALNHPNIITIHDAHSHSGVAFIVMEYVPGTTLDRLVGPRLRLSDTLNIAIQIADALAAAHAAGIIHRDVKPANVMITATHAVKVLDFGIARMPGTGAATHAVESVETVTLRQVETATGIILGTAAYMSPEQAEGRQLDNRTDIFSFGAVLYEMVTGRRAFQGKSLASTLSAVLRDEPEPVSRLARDIPYALERVVRRCLRKNPDERYQHMADLKLDLRELKEDMDSRRVNAEAPSPPRRRRAVDVTITISAFALIAVLAGLFYFRHRTPAPTSALTRVTSDAGLSYYPALSPDGKLLAYVSDRADDGHLDLWLRHLGSGDAVRLTTDAWDESAPSFSPDGSRIAYRSSKDGGGIYVVSTLGGTARRLVEGGFEPRYSPDGQVIAYHGKPLGRASLTALSVPAAGGMPLQLAPTLAFSRSPIWLPGGERLLVSGSEHGRRQGWYVVSARGGAPLAFIDIAPVLEQAGGRLVTEGLWLAKPLASGDVRIVTSGAAGLVSALWQIDISGTTWQPITAFSRVTSGTADEAYPVIAAGKIAFATVTSNHDIWLLPLSGTGQAAGSLKRLTPDLARDTWPTLSADGKRLAFVSDRSGRNEIWMANPAVPGAETLINTQQGPKRYPTLTANGELVAFDVNGKVYATSFNGCYDGAAL